MATDVSSLARILSGGKEDGERNRELTTRDFLGGTVAGAAEVDRTAADWERHFDLLSGRMYPQRSRHVPANRELQDLNLPPPPATAAKTMPEDSAALDLKLVASTPSVEYPSVCTLEKVKLALERAERESRSKYNRAECSSPSQSSSTTSSSIKRRLAGEDEEAAESSGEGGGGMAVAGCPRCLLYVLIAKRDPRCPRCDSHVPVAAAEKKARIDLNSVDI